MALAGNIGDIDMKMFSGETLDQQCTMCKHKGNNTEADKFCVDCVNYYCLTCVEVHNDVPLLMGHKILDKEEVPPGSNQALPIALTERCRRHSHKHIDLYCPNHDDVGCSTCMTVNHRLCGKIRYIPDVINTNESSFAPNDTKLKLESVSKSLRQQTDNIRQVKDKVLKRKNILLEQIRKYRKEINERLDELEKKSIAETEDKFKAIVDKLEEGIKQLNTNQAIVTSTIAKLMSKNTTEVFVNIKEGEKLSSDSKKCIEDSKTKAQVREIDFTPNLRIRALLAEIQTLGKDADIVYETIEGVDGLRRKSVTSRRLRSPPPITGSLPIDFWSKFS